jgi:hypothetical protein
VSQGTGFRAVFPGPQAKRAAGLHIKQFIVQKVENPPGKMHMGHKKARVILPKPTTLVCELSI